MELEDDYGQDSERRGGWDTAGWGKSQERAWSSESGSDSHSNSPFVNRNGGDWTSGAGKRANNFTNWNESAHQPGYKTGPSSAHPPAIPSLMEVGGPGTRAGLPPGPSQGGMAGFGAMNDAQKKKLPSWIRAGLEKMERDKLKKEQEDERKRRFEERKRIEKLERAEELSKDPSKSKFDNANSDTEDQDYGDGDEQKQKASQSSNNFSQESIEDVKQRKSRFEYKKLDEQLEEDFDEDDDDATNPNAIKSEPIQRS